ncbi:SDR family oxidoreductase [Palleronia rufa]|uniref:SDR family oxidoreductase n=1 Tax=Palleronia rufa TaxID=1530186 RepID=UPI00068F0775|nr:SDR family oxidoreductase [Palleronia rufa]
MPTIVISGASAGVGRATARRFAAPGARIALIARSGRRLEAAAQEVRRAGGQALVLPLDVADAAAVEDAAEKTEQAFGPIDIWINVAMVTVLARVIDTEPDEYRRVTEVTYLGTVHGTLAALRRMSARDRGVIVQVGSALAYRSIPLQSAYCAAKSAIVGFTDSLRSELIHDRSNVRITAVQLPGVNTPQFDWARNKMGYRQMPVPPIFQPEAIAEAIWRAAHKPRREYWLGFSSFKAIMSERIAPSIGDRYVARKAFESQLTDERLRDRPDNLYDTVDGDPGAHGRFDGQATERSPAIWASEHRDALVIAGGLGLVGLLVGMVLRRPQQTRDRPRRLP